MPDRLSTPDPAFIAEWNANLQAKRLRDLGLSYPAIAIVVAEYHGIDKSQDHWRGQLRKQGAGPVWRGNGRGKLRNGRTVATR